MPGVSWGRLRAPLDHDAIKWNRIMISSLCLSMISAQTRFRVCREGKPVSTFPDHALGRNRHLVRAEPGDLCLHLMATVAALPAPDVSSHPGRLRSGRA